MRDEKNRGEEGERGVISLEASVSLSLFLFLILTIYSFFLIFDAKYTIKQALLESGKSLAIETCVTDRVIKTDRESGKLSERLPSGVLSMLEALGLEADIRDEEFASFTKWYKSTERTRKAVQERFCAYLGGTEEADRLLSRLGVEGGLSGMDFSGTRVVNGDLYASVTWKCRLIFDFPSFGLSGFSMKSTVRTALWK